MYMRLESFVEIFDLVRRGKDIEREHLVTDGLEDELLTLGSIKVTRRVARSDVFERCLTIEDLLPSIDPKSLISIVVIWVGGIDNRLRDIYLYATDRIDEIDKSLKVYEPHMIDLDPCDLSHFFGEIFECWLLVMVIFLERATIELINLSDSSEPEIGHIDSEISRDREHSYLFSSSKVDDLDGICEIASIMILSSDTDNEKSRIFKFLSRRDTIYETRDASLKKPWLVISLIIWREYLGSCQKYRRQKRAYWLPIRRSRSTQRNYRDTKYHRHHPKPSKKS